MAKNNRRSGAAVAKRPPVRLKSPPVSVSYPAEKETIPHPSYTLQIAAGEAAAAVEVSIDRGEWRPCRESLGLWWYDWSGYDSGGHEAVARLRMPDGTTELSEPRTFEVKLG